MYNVRQKNFLMSISKDVEVVINEKQYTGFLKMLNFLIKVMVT